MTANTHVDFIAGGISGCVAKTAIAPFDRVKIHFQLSSPHLIKYSGSVFGVFRAIREIYHNEGVYGLYKGHSATLLRIFPYAAINFASYSAYKRKAESLFGREYANLHPIARFVTGSFAGMTSVIITYPLDLLRARLAFHTQKRESLTVEWSNIVGSRSVYRGLIPTLIGMPIYSGLSFFVFDSLKMWKLHRENRVALSGTERFIFGYIAGAFAQTCSYPFDVIRRRMQVYHIASHLQSSEYGMVSIARSILKSQGLSGFWKGLSINFIKVAPATGISFMTFEFLKEKMESTSLHK